MLFKKCCAYETLICEIQAEYAYFKAYVEHKRGNKELCRTLLEEDHYGVFSNYAQNGINDYQDIDIVKELQVYLKMNNFKLKYLDTFELQNMMKR